MKNRQLRKVNPVIKVFCRPEDHTRQTQRISVAHHDTNYRHLYITINKIRPTLHDSRAVLRLPHPR